MLLTSNPLNSPLANLFATTNWYSLIYCNIHDLPQHPKTALGIKITKIITKKKNHNLSDNVK